MNSLFSGKRHRVPRDLFGRVDAMDLERVLGDIQTDRGNLHVDGLPNVIRMQRSPYGTSLRKRAPSITLNCDIGWCPRHGSFTPETGRGMWGKARQLRGSVIGSGFVFQRQS